MAGRVLVRSNRTGDAPLDLLGKDTLSAPLLVFDLGGKESRLSGSTALGALGADIAGGGID